MSMLRRVILLVAFSFGLVKLEDLAADSISQKASTIGLLADLTGPNAVNGESCRQGFEVARHSYSLRDRESSRKETIQFVYGDHRGDAMAGVNEFRKLTSSERVLAVITSRSQVAMALNPLARAAGIPLLGVAGYSDFVRSSEFAFRYFPTTAQEGTVLAAKVHELGFQRISIISLEDEWTLSLEREFKAAYSKLGTGTVVSSETVVATEADFSTLLVRLGRTNPDLIFVNVGVAQAGPLIRRIREQGLRQQIVANFWVSYDQVRRTAGGAHVGGVIYVSVNLAKPRFLALLEKYFPGASPSAITYCCYSALRAVLQLFQDRPGISNAQEFSAALRELKSLRLEDETIDVRGREVQYDVVTYQIAQSK